MKGYRDLIVWQKSISLVTFVYKITKTFPSEELYGLSSQMRRSAVSIPSNIAEGSRRSTKKDFRHFLCIAFGSGAELETQLLIARNLGYGTEKEIVEIESLLNEIMKMLNTLRKSMCA